MAATTRLLVNHNLKRCIFTSAVNRADAKRQGRFLNKLMGADVGKRKWYQNQQRSGAVGPIAAEKLTSNHASRRMAVLNKLFMQHITELMATGEVSPELLGRSIEITHVRVTPNFRNVLVYWASKRADPDAAETARVLRDCAYRLRHELTQLHVIGQVPTIEFVKNRQLEALARLEHCFGIADYGDDYEPSIDIAPRRNVPTINKTLAPEVRRKILELEDSLENEEEREDDSQYDVDLPEMRHDVLGLDQSAIMTRVMVSLKRSREGARNRLLNVTTIDPAMETPMVWDIGNTKSAKEEAKAFSEFLVKRQIEEKRKLRRENKEGVLEYNMRNQDDEREVYDNDDDFFAEVDHDIDAFEDIKLESLK